jgi:nonsense-mediated mRNA decay protein 3
MMFCVECGKEGNLYQGLCVDCYLAKNVFITIPKQIDVEVCAHCGARRKGKIWISSTDDLIEQCIIENVKRNKNVIDFDLHIIPTFEDENNVSVQVITHAKVSDLKAEEEHTTKIRIKRLVCDECSKQHGGYWEAKVQLRGSKRGLSEKDLEQAIEIVDTIVSGREKKDKSAFVTKMEKIHNGLDFYLGSKSLGKTISKELAREFGGEIKESHKLVGKKEGKDVYRTTYAVRALDYRPGDFIQFEGKVLRVINLSSNKVLLRVLDQGENISIKSRKLKDAKLLGGKEIIQEMVVVSRSENEIQVLDPETLKTVDVVMPTDFEVDGESVKIVKYKSGYFLVGD